MKQNLDILIKQFNEVKDIIPYDNLIRRKEVSTTLYGEILDWCRDYFNEPKNPPLAYMLIGYYYTNKEIEKMNKTFSTFVENL